MTWARLDDGFHSHPKVQATSLAGRGLWATAVAFSAHYLTDGFIRERVMHDMARVRHGRAALRELVEHGLVDRVEDGYAIHDFLDYNPSREDVEADREGAKERQRRKRQRDRQGSLPWSDSDPSVTPKSRPSVTSGRGGREEEPPTQNSDESHAAARSNELAETVEQVVAVLRRCSRFTVSEGVTDVQVENAISAHEGKDALAAAHEAVVSGSDPAYRTTDAGRAFLYALRRLPPGKTRQEAEGKQDGRIPGQNLGQRRSDCPDCKGSGYVLDEDSNDARPCACRKTGAAA